MNVNVLTEQDRFTKHVSWTRLLNAFTKCADHFLNDLGMHLLHALLQRILGMCWVDALASHIHVLRLLNAFPKTANHTRVLNTFTEHVSLMHFLDAFFESVYRTSLVDTFTEHVYRTHFLDARKGRSRHVIMVIFVSFGAPRCGSTHQCTSHHECPLNKKLQKWIH